MRSVFHCLCMLNKCGRLCKWCAGSLCVNDGKVTKKKMKQNFFQKFEKLCTVNYHY